jgi:hypothetical protein
MVGFPGLEGGGDEAFKGYRVLVWGDEKVL